MSDDSAGSVLSDVSIPSRYPTACVLLALWELPWSTTRQRFAARRLEFLARLGLDVLEFRDARTDIDGL